MNEEIKELGGISLKQSINVRWLSLINLLESIDRSFLPIKKVLSTKKKTFAIERETVQGLIRLLLPFKELLIKLQTGKTPSLHYVFIGIGTLQSTLSSFDALLEYEKKNKVHSEKENAFSLDFDDTNSFHEDEGELVNFPSSRLIFNRMRSREENDVVAQILCFKIEENHIKPF